MVYLNTIKLYIYQYIKQTITNYKYVILSFKLECYVNMNLLYSFYFYNIVSLSLSLSLSYTLSS